MSKIDCASSEPLAALRYLLLRHEPTGQARMTEPGYTAKYLRVDQPITESDLAAHLAGDMTLACVLQRDDLAFVAACDIDSGGEAMVRRVMRAAEMRACHAYGFVLDSGSHSGGHVWLFFEEAHAARDLQVLMRDILSDAQCPSTEIYPNGADLRLPFGLHRRCNRRGTLLLTSTAAPLDLHADLAGVLATFLAEVRLTSDIPVRIALEAQAARRHAVADAIAAARPRHVAPDAHWREVIATFNTSTDLVSLLEGYGARAVYHYAGGKTLLRCAASQDHAHGDVHPSLVVEPGRGHQAGRMICGCYCPTCRLHNQPGQVMDAFEVFCRMEHISKREGVQRLQTRATGYETRRQEDKETRHTTHEMKATDNRQPTTDNRIVQRRLVEIQSDHRVQPLDRRLLAYVISHGAQGQGLANATLAAALGVRPDSIKRAKRRLRELGYIDVAISTDGQSPSAITIIDPDSLLEECQEAAPEGGVQEAPPSHVSESTCVEQTPPPESDEGRTTTDERSTAPTGNSQPVTALRRRRAVLLNMLRAGVSERRRLAFTAELATIEEKLNDRQPTTDNQQPTTDNQQPTTDNQQLTADSRIAQPTDPHPALSDGQLTALLRDTLCNRLPPPLQALLERVSWHQAKDGIILVCVAHDLALVAAELLGLSRAALADLAFAEVGSVVTVQIGKPTSVGIRPDWIGETVWVTVPVWLRSLLVGSVLVDGRLYGATREQTRELTAYGEVLSWLLDQAADHAVQSSLFLPSFDSTRGASGCA